MKTVLVIAGVVLGVMVVYLAFNTHLFGIHLQGRESNMQNSKYNLRYSAGSVKAKIVSVNGNDTSVSDNFSVIEAAPSSSGGFPLAKKNMQEGKNQITIRLSGVQLFESEGGNVVSPEYAKKRGWGGQTRKSTLDDAQASFSIITEPGDSIHSQKTITETSLDKYVSSNPDASLPIEMTLEFEN